MKAAAGYLLKGVRDIARDGTQIVDRGEQTLGIRMFGISKERFDISIFHYLACIHDSDVVRRLGDNPQVVSDQDHRQPPFLPQSLHQPH